MMDGCKVFLGISTKLNVGWLHTVVVGMLEKKGKIMMLTLGNISGKKKQNLDR